MEGLRLILALHDHQPVGNFDGVIETAYRDAYRPFLEVLEDYPTIPFVLHTSGPLMEWLAAHKPEYIESLRGLVKSSAVEILGGGFYEPILPMIPHRDRVGQIRSYATYLADLLDANVRGMWMPERVWEQSLVSALAEAGVEYTVLDDFHFQRTGLGELDLHGYYLTEDDGRLVKVFPASERLRYTIPFQEPHATYEYLRHLAAARPGCTVVFADDGEKFGSWPKTYDHVYTTGWLRRFCDMIVGNADWLQPTTFARAVDSTLPLGKIYLPDSSYREMTEWVLPPQRLAAYESAVAETRGEPAAERLLPFVRAGGFWRNFKARYAETDEMYTRMLGLSERLERALPDADPDLLEIARQELYRAQCNCPYWHGAFGGLYLPHLRNAVYKHLIGAHNALDAAEGLSGPRVALATGDFNLDARQEARLENDLLVAFVRPAQGGHIYELDHRRAQVNVLATLDRRPEVYHAAIAAGACDAEFPRHDAATVHDDLPCKQEGLDRLLIYDRYPRKALVDHFFPIDARLDDLVSGRDVERGDFVTGTYLAKVARSAQEVRLIMERPGRVDAHVVQVRKTLTMTAGSPTLTVHYELEDLPRDTPLHFAVELNLAAMAGRADDRYYCSLEGARLGMLDTRIDLPKADGVGLHDEWLDLAVGLSWSRASGLWCFPIQTVSQSEGGYEAVYQSSAVIPHWHITGDAAGRWDVTIAWTFSRARPEPAVPTPAPRVLGRVASMKA